MNNIEISAFSAERCPFKAAIFDFDGTISTLRCGWEQVMEDMMLRTLLPSGRSREELLDLIRGYIDESTGIQTIFQMEWLAGQVSSLCGSEPLDPWAYKDEYNQALLDMVNGRIHRLESGEAKPEEFLVKGSVQFLRLLAERKIEIYIASGTDDVDLQREASLLGISALATKIKGAPHRKKDCSKGAVIRELVEEHHLSGHELMVAGDGKVEILLGNEAGAVTIGVATWETNMNGVCHPKKQIKLRQAGADYIAADFTPFVSQWMGGNEE